jgi:cobalamin synthase
MVEKSKQSSRLILYAPLIGAVLSVLSSVIYISQRMGMQPRPMSRFVQNNLEEFAGVSLACGLIGFILGLILWKKFGAMKLIRLGVYSTIVALMMYLCLPL